MIYTKSGYDKLHTKEDNSNQLPLVKQ